MSNAADLIGCHTSKLKVCLNANPTEAIWLDPQHFRLFEKVGLNLVVLVLLDGIGLKFVLVAISPML